MATEEIKLVGSFKDDITPQLKKLNRELNAVTRSFSKLGRKIRPVTREMGKLAVSTRSVADNLRSQKMSLDEATRSMRSYTTASRKAASQQRKMRPARTPRSGGGVVPRGGGGGGGGYGKVALGAGGAAFGATLGAQAGQLINTAIMRGFDYGARLITGVFKGLGNAIGERVEDEMSDIQSAGGMFALDKKQAKGDRLFANFTQARNMQEELNRELARSAASLPGATSDYVQSAKQLTDTVFGTFAKDKSKFSDLAVSLGGKEGATSQDDITKVLTKFTEQSVLLSQGQKGGMPLGMLLEQLISQENVNITGMKRRYAQLRKNPLLANMLEDAQTEMNAAGAMTSERFAAVMKALDNALPEEVINSMRRSVAGVTESIRSAFLDPEVGLLGLGRPLKDSVKAINSFGQYVDANGIAVRNMADAADEETTTFKLIRDIIAGFGGALAEIAQVLPAVLDPLQPLANALMDMRQKAVDFARMFTGMSNSFSALGLEQASLRGAILAFAEIIKVPDKLYQDILGKLKDPDADFGSLIKDVGHMVLQSDFMGDLGETLGNAMAEIVVTLASILTGTVDELSGSKFTSAFAKAFKTKGGPAAISKIFMGIFETMGKAVMALVSNFPMESLIVGLLAIAPALIAGIGAALPSLLMMIGPSIAGAGAGGIGAAIAGGLSAILASPALIAAVVAGLAITAKATEESRGDLLGTGTDTGLAGAAQARTNAVYEGGRNRALEGNGLAGIMDGLMGELTWVVHDFIKGFGDIFTGLYNIVVGAFTDPKMVGEGITQIMTGLFSLFTMIGHALIAVGYAVPGAIMGFVVVLVTVIKNLFVGIGHAIIGAWMGNDWTNKLGNDIRYLFNSMGQAIMNAATAVGDWGARLATSIGDFFGNMMKAIGDAARSIPFIGNLIPGGDKPTSTSYNGNTSRTMGLGSAISSEMKNKPAGSHLVIANSSEQVIPAANGFMPSGGGGGNNQTFNINVSGGGSAEETAEIVAQQIVYAIQKSTYNELYTS